jgi:hypothetical protein
MTTDKEATAVARLISDLTEGTLVLISMVGIVTAIAILFGA